MAVGHDDRDVIYGIISCRNNDALLHKNGIVTHVAFRQFRAAFALWPGKILIFDSLVMHCATNPRDTNAFVFSIYTNLKTASFVHVNNFRASGVQAIQTYGFQVPWQPRQ
jgi:hypothetical protein